MVIPFTSDQFFDVFRDYNEAVWPAQPMLVAFGLGALILAFRPGPGSGVGVSAILAFLWAWTAVAYHLAFFTRISVAAYAFAAVSLAASLVFIVQGVVRRRLEFQWRPGPGANGGLALVAFALVIYPFWSVFDGHAYPATPTFGLPCPTTLFTMGMMGFAAPPIPRSALVAPVLWCLVGSQAAFFLDVRPDWGLVPAALFGIYLLATAGRGPKAVGR